MLPSEQALLIWPLPVNNPTLSMQFSSCSTTLDTTIEVAPLPDGDVNSIVDGCDVLLMLCTQS